MSETTHREETVMGSKSDEIKVFEHGEFGSLRVVERDGETWFVARDVALALGYADPAEAIQRHCKKSNDLNVGVSPIPSPKIIPESDLYRLVLRSNLPSAERFQDWVVEEVLPTLRKTGRFEMSAPALPDFTNPANAARAWAEKYEQCALAETKVLALAAKAQADRPKVLFGNPAIFRDLMEA